MFEDIMTNPLMDTDCYNLGHYLQKTNQDWEISHILNRKDGMFVYGFNHYVLKTFNIKIEMDMVEDAELYAKQMGLPFPTDMWMRIVQEFNGKIPIRAQGVPDGTWVPKGSVFGQVENTEEGFGEVVTYFEPKLLRCAFASGCATRAYFISKYLKDKKLVNHRIHSFGLRGHVSDESSVFAGTAWNLFMTGTDDFHTKQYTPNAQIKSIMATAHKVMQQFDDEYEGALRVINQAKNTGIVAIVIDTYDPINFIENYLVKLSKHAKEIGVHVVYRPDSGDLLQQTKQIYNISVNEGLDNISVIIGEGITPQKIEQYDKWFEENEIPLSFVFFGMGAGFYKDIERDTTGLAMKTAYSNGADRMKLVKGSPFKQSIPGNVGLFRNKETGEIYVDYGRDENSDRTPLFVDIYHFNARSDRQETFVQNWDDVNKRVKIEIEKGYVNQKDIIISELIKSNIKKFQDKYW